jgi:hypothetical protein
MDEQTRSALPSCRRASFASLQDFWRYYQEQYLLDTANLAA